MRLQRVLVSRRLLSDVTVLAALWIIPDLELTIDAARDQVHAPDGPEQILITPGPQRRRPRLSRPIGAR